MKDTIYLVATRTKIDRMTKSLPGVQRDEVLVKVEIEISPDAFKPPVVVQKVVINDWRDGIDIEDVQFKGGVITPDEAEVIRQRRLAKMRSILEQQGFTVIDPDEEDGQQT